MGYTTSFTGRFELDRELLPEHAEALRSREIPDGPDDYSQWVPSEDLRGIQWDGGEKFYDYVPWLSYIARKLGEWGYRMNGTVLWHGEQVGDVGRLVVRDNQVSVEPWEHNPRVRGPQKSPVEELLARVLGQDQSTDQYAADCSALRRAMTPSQREALAQLVNGGPVYDGDVISKAARDDLLRWGLAGRAHVRGQQGYTVANYRGGDVHGAK